MEMELLLEELTDPASSSIDWAKVSKFVQLVKRDKDTGAADCVQMLLDKIRHRNQKVALAALTVLEACVKACGAHVHGVVGKFRFLNEFIKMVSPKYYSETPTEVKRRVLATMQQWNYSLMEQSKVREAYQMLLRQGVEFPDDVAQPELNVPVGAAYLDISAKSMVKRYSPLEEDKKKAKLLEKLLKSKDPNDLMKANKLIKKMVDQDAKKGQRVAETRKELDVVQNNAKLLTDMLQHYSPGVDPRLDSNEVVQDLYKSCLDMRPKMFKMASQLDEQDQTLGDVLAANDHLTRVLDLYDATKAKEPQNMPAAPATAAMGGSAPAMTATRAQSADEAPLSLLDLDFGGAPSNPAPAANTGASLDATFGMLGMSNPTPATQPASAGNDLLGLLSGPPPAATRAPMQAMGGLGGLGGMGGAPMMATTTPSTDLFGMMNAAPAPVSMLPPPSIETLNIPFESIQSGGSAVVYEKNNMRITFNFACNSPHPTISTTAVSFVNVGPMPISNLSFQVAVPKALQVKLQAASSNIVAPNQAQAVTQVMLIANPTKAPIKIRFKLDFAINGQMVSDMGECSSFPPM